MTILIDHEAVQFTRQGVEVMQFFHEKQRKFCKKQQPGNDGPMSDLWDLGCQVCCLCTWLLG